MGQVTCTCETPKVEYQPGCPFDCMCDVYRVDCRPSGYVCTKCHYRIRPLPKGVAK